MGLLNRIKNFFASNTIQHSNTDTLLINTTKSNPEVENKPESDIPFQNDEREIPEIFRCRTCGKTFSTEAELKQHHISQYDIPDLTTNQNQIPFDNSGKRFESVPDQLAQSYTVVQSAQKKEIEYPEEFLCKNCGRTFLTQYELENHVHRPGDILAEPDRQIDKEGTIKTLSQKSSIDTRFINNHEVTRTNLGSGLLRYNKFPGKIGYVRKNK